MKLTLDQLRVDSYATQVSGNELTEVKGGTTPWCVYAGIAVVAIGVGYLIGSSSSGSSSSSASASCPQGCTVECGSGSESSQSSTGDQ